MLVQVGHRRHEPSFDSLLHVDLRGVGVHHWGELIARLQVLALGRLRAVAVGGETRHRVASALLFVEPLGLVQPVLRGHVLRPGVLKAAVVEDHVHHYLQAFLMGLVAKQFVFLVRAKARIHLIIIGGGIAVVGRETIFRVRRVVLQHRGEPKGRHTQFLEVVQMFADAVQVTTMSKRWFCAIFHVMTHALDLRGVVRSLCKTVWHQHVEHVGIGESHALVAAHLAGLQLILHVFAFLSLHLSAFKRQRHHAGLGALQVHVDKQVVG